MSVRDIVDLSEKIKYVKNKKDCGEERRERRVGRKRRRRKRKKQRRNKGEEEHRSNRNIWAKDKNEKFTDKYG